jgi:acyl-CoA thioester hydrolase
MTKKLNVLTRQAPRGVAGRSASVLQPGRVELQDTDMTGHYHHSTVIRWVEAAERTLLEHLGMHALPTMPRVRYQADYRRRVWPYETAVLHLRVARVGRSSLRYHFDVHCSGNIAVNGEMAVVKVDRAVGGSVPFDGRERDLLLTSGSYDPCGLERALEIERADPWGIGYG